MKRDIFLSYHPAVNFLYFLAVIIMSMMFNHPLCLSISLFGAIFYAAYFADRRSIVIGFFVSVPVIIVTAILNPLFNHAGMTILAYFPSGNPLTLESILFGVASGVMLVCVIMWFISFNRVMTSDKLIYLFGRIIPTLSLVLSMTLRFVPRLVSKFREVAAAQKCLGRGITHGNLVSRIRNFASLISIIISWSLESAIDTADSMRSRGYGLPSRSAFSIFNIERRDIFAIFFIIACLLYIMIGVCFKVFYYSYFPFIQSGPLDLYNISVFVAYFGLVLMPAILNVREGLKWGSIKSKI